MDKGQVCPKPAAIVAKPVLSRALSAAWARVALRIGKGAFADAAGFDVKTVDRALTGPSLPYAEHLLNSLVADPTALNEVLALYGIEARPLRAHPANDLETVAGLSQAAAAVAEALQDGVRCHRDTCQLADIFRPLVAKLNAIVAEADQIRGHAA